MALMALLASGFASRVRGEADARSSRAALVAILATAVAAELARALSTILGGVIWPEGALSPIAVLTGLPGGVLIDALGLWLVVETAHRWPKRWWVVLGAPAAMAAAVWTLLAPLVLPPMGRGDMAIAGPSPILTFVQSAGFPAHTLYVFPGADPAAVDVESFGPVRHLAVSRTALDAPTSETYAALGHVLGHDRHHDLWSLAVLNLAAILLAFYLIHRLAEPLARRFGRGSRSLSDPAPAPTIALIAWLAMIAWTPAFNLFDRLINYRADAFALSVTRDPVGMGRWLIRTEADCKADPSPLEVILFYDHPPLRTRLERVFRETKRSPAS